jgi:myo-inositol 2-dehydrogenase/D-chiro-inositol 1-dehydrogenase
MGSDHARNLATSVDGAALSAVADVDLERAHAVAREVGARVASDGLALIGAHDVDAVVIASTVASHLEFTLAAIGASKPVLCEKPLAATADEALRVVAAEEELGRRLVAVGFMRRVDPGYLELKATLDGGRIGEPLLLHNVHRNPSVAAWFTRATTMTDSIVHEIDVTRWLLGEEIVAVQVIAPKRAAAAPPGLQDPQFAVFTTASGVLSTVEFFGSAGYGYDVRCEAVGTAGTAKVDAGVAPDFRVRFAAAYLAELEAWIDGLRRGEIVGPSAWDGYAATRIAEAGVDAASTGRRVTIAPSRPPDVYRQPGD